MDSTASNSNNTNSNSNSNNDSNTQNPESEKAFEEMWEKLYGLRNSKSSLSKTKSTQVEEKPKIKKKYSITTKLTNSTDITEQNQISPFVRKLRKQGSLKTKNEYTENEIVDKIKARSAKVSPAKKSPDEENKTAGLWNKLLNFISPFK